MVRKCYPAMRHHEGDIIEVRDCVLLKAGPRKNDLPFVAKIAHLWENPEDGRVCGFVRVVTANLCLLQVK